MAKFIEVHKGGTAYLLNLDDISSIWQPLPEPPEEEGGAQDETD